MVEEEQEQEVVIQVEVVEEVEEEGEVMEETSLLCSYCNTVFATSEGLARHVGALHTYLQYQETFPCHDCNKHYDTKNKLRVHFNSVHKDPMSCIHCFKTFKSKSAFQRHVIIHSEATNSCDVCGKMFRRRDSLRRHMNEVHDGRRTRGVYPCASCGKKFTKKESLQKHMAAAHSAARRASAAIFKKYMTKVKEGSRIVCRACAISFGCNSDFRQHQRKYHGGAPDIIFGATGDDFLLVDKHQASMFEYIVRCEYCDVSFATIRQLLAHKKLKHRGEAVFQCVLCDKAYKSVESLRQHRSRHHTGKDFSCDEEQGCGKKFKTREGLTKHKKICGKPRHRKHFNQLDKWSKGRRAKKVASTFLTQLDRLEGEERASVISQMVKIRPDLLDRYTSIPLTMADIVEVRIIDCFLIIMFKLHIGFFFFLLMFIPQMIHDKNLTDSQVMGVLRKLRKFWKFGIPKYIARALKFKKRQLDHLYTKVIQCHVCHNSVALPTCVATVCTPMMKPFCELSTFL